MRNNMKDPPLTAVKDARSAAKKNSKDIIVKKNSKEVIVKKNSKDIIVKNSEPSNVLKKSNELFICPIVKCNKKHKSEIKRQKHILKNHYYETRNRNSFKFDHLIRAQIYDAASSYIIELDKIRSSDYSGESSAKNLLPQLDLVVGEDLKRMTIAQSLFAQKIFQQNLICDWRAVMDDLERFFNLGLPYDGDFCPTLTIHFLWHVLMQKPNLYVDICKKTCIEIMPHCIEQDSTDYFIKLFEYRYNKLPYSFPSSIHHYSTLDIRKLFINLCDQELKQIEKELKLSVKREKRNDYLKDIALKMNVSLEKIDRYETYHLRGYKMGYTGKKLEYYVEEQIKLAQYVC